MRGDTRVGNKQEAEEEEKEENQIKGCSSPSLPVSLTLFEDVIHSCPALGGGGRGTCASLQEELYIEARSPDNDREPPSFDDILQSSSSVCSEDIGLQLGHHLQGSTGLIMVVPSIKGLGRVNYVNEMMGDCPTGRSIDFG